MEDHRGTVAETLKLAGAAIAILGLVMVGLVLFNVIPGGPCRAVGGLQLMCTVLLVSVGAVVLLVGIVMERMDRRRNSP